MTIPPGEPVHIAFWGVLSGADASLGTDSMYGVEIAIDDQGDKFLGHDIQLTSEDGLCTPEGGATAGQKLAADTHNRRAHRLLVLRRDRRRHQGHHRRRPDHDLAVQHASCAHRGRTAARSTRATCARRTTTTSRARWRPSSPTTSSALKTAATIHDGSSYAQALQQVFADEFTALGGTITIQEAVSKDQTDMKPVLTRIAATKPDFIYYPIFIAAGGYITKQLKEVPGLENVKHMSADGTFSADFVKAAGDAAIGHYISSPDFTAFTGDYAGFVAKYQAKFGDQAAEHLPRPRLRRGERCSSPRSRRSTVQAADGTLYVPLGALRDALFATKDFQGVTGTLTCTPTGDCGAKAIGVYQITATEVGPPITWPPAAPIWKPSLVDGAGTPASSHAVTKPRGRTGSRRPTPRATSPVTETAT